MKRAVDGWQEYLEDIFRTIDWLEIDYDEESIDQIIEKLEYAIEQHPSFLHVIPQEELAAYEADHQKRRYSYKEKS